LPESQLIHLLIVLHDVAVCDDGPRDGDVPEVRLVNDAGSPRRDRRRRRRRRRRRAVRFRRRPSGLAHFVELFDELEEMGREFGLAAVLLSCSALELQCSWAAVLLGRWVLPYYTAKLLEVVIIRCNALKSSDH